MTNDLSASSSIIINASIEEVWKAITTPELIKQWFFGAAPSASVPPLPGSPLLAPSAG